jgi:hypothetical protein
MAPTLPLSIDGSTVVGGHVIPLGELVTVTRGGVVQSWGEVRVIRHDRNRTYRLAFANGTYVTAHEWELTLASQ